MRIIAAFCLKTNSKNLLIMKSGSLDVLYGIRFLTICFIVLGHQIGIYNGGGPTINGREFDQVHTCKSLISGGECTGLSGMGRELFFNSKQAENKRHLQIIYF